MMDQKKIEQKYFLGSSNIYGVRPEPSEVEHFAMPHSKGIHYL